MAYKRDSRQREVYSTYSVLEGEAGSSGREQISIVFLFPPRTAWLDLGSELKKETEAYVLWSVHQGS